MAMRRWDPFRDLLSVQNELNRMFGRTFGSELTEGAPAGAWVPPLDVFETEQGYTIVVELAGMSSDEVDISVQNNVLTLRGERKFYEGTPEEAFHRVERRFGPFQRTIALPQQCDTERVEASMTDGLLRIDVPKAEKAKPKRVEVKGA
jgi:HSP20 family protein